MILSPAILEEYQRVGAELGRMFPAIDLEPILGMVALNSRIVQDAELPEAVCPDPADDKFIAAAIAANASHVVSGDKALLKVGEYAGVRVVSPGAFVRTCLEQD